MNAGMIKFERKENEVYVYGYPELEGRKGVDAGDGMAFFFGCEWDNYELYAANMLTGKIRKISSKGGLLLVDNDDIDYEAIAQACRHGIENAKNKAVCYAGMNRWDGFKNGLCAISWMLYPDGEYFADSDGFGMESNDEEVVYAIMDTNLDFIEPFRPIKNVSEYLKKIRTDN